MDQGTFSILGCGQLTVRDRPVESSPQGCERMPSRPRDLAVTAQLPRDAPRPSVRTARSVLPSVLGWLDRVTGGFTAPVSPAVTTLFCMAEHNDDDLPVIDLAQTEGYVVDDSDEDDPVLLRPDGTPIETWRENYPYDERMTREEYEVTKRKLQIELLKWQNWTKETGQRHIILFEGRDAAGKGGTIKRFNEHLNPRGARNVALEKPSPRESTS